MARVEHCIQVTISHSQPSCSRRSPFTACVGRTVGAARNEVNMLSLLTEDDVAKELNLHPLACTAARA